MLNSTLGFKLGNVFKVGSILLSGSRDKRSVFSLQVIVNKSNMENMNTFQGEL